MVSFDNTEIAFSGKSNKDLTRAYLLFKLIGSTKLVSFSKVLSSVVMSMNLPFTGIFKATIFKQFCGGESLKECEQTVENLAQHNIKTMLEYSAEGKETDEDFDSVAEEKLRTIDFTGKNPVMNFVALKPTGIMRIKLLEKISADEALNEDEKHEFEKAKKRITRLCQAASDNNIRLMIDAEETWIQPAIDGLAREAMEKYNTSKPVVYNTIQMYRTDRLNFLKQSHAEAKNSGYHLGIKLVRGAYMEMEIARAQKNGYKSPIHKDKQSTDKDFDLAQKYCVENHDRISLFAGTHNENSCKCLAELIEIHKIEKQNPSFVFSQLFGMSDHITYNLAAAGFHTVKYVPYGPVKDVLPYLIRRAEENTSIAGQAGRELRLIIKEKNRRKPASAL